MINLSNIFVDIINKQVEKEDKYDIWKNSKYYNLVKLQSNNIGYVGEIFIENICKLCNISCNINNYKKTGKGSDGIILNKTVEIKTAHKGSRSKSFQHELGEIPWYSDIMIFIDIDPKCIYLTIFKNFTENKYKNNEKCYPYFPTRKITWRKKMGAFKLDTTVKINEENILKGYTYKITENGVDINLLKNFIICSINDNKSIDKLAEELINLNIK